MISEGAKSTERSLWSLKDTGHYTIGQGTVYREGWVQLWLKLFGGKAIFDWLILTNQERLVSFWGGG